MLLWHSVILVQCCSGTVTLLHSVAPACCCFGTVLLWHSVSPAQCCCGTLLLLHGIAVAQRCLAQCCLARCCLARCFLPTVTPRPIRAPPGDAGAAPAPHQAPLGVRSGRCHQPGSAGSHGRVGDGWVAPGDGGGRGPIPQGSLWGGPRRTLRPLRPTELREGGTEDDPTERSANEECSALLERLRRLRAQTGRWGRASAGRGDGGSAACPPNASPHPRRPTGCSGSWPRRSGSGSGWHSGRFARGTPRCPISPHPAARRETPGGAPLWGRDPQPHAMSAAPRPGPTHCSWSGCGSAAQTRPPRPR